MCDALTTSLPVDDWTLNDKAQSEEASLCNKGLVFLMYAGICNYKSIKMLLLVKQKDSGSFSTSDLDFDNSHSAMRQLNG